MNKPVHLKDVGNLYPTFKSKKSCIREDNNGYEPDNCRFVTYLVNNQNKRNTKENNNG